MTKFLKNIKDFFFTLLVPLIYLFNLIIVWQAQKEIFASENQVLGVSLSPLSYIKYSIFFCLILSGLILWFTGYLFIGNSFSVTPRAKKLVIGGPYKYFRHPIYVGIFLTFVSLSLITNSRLGLFYSLTIVSSLNYIRSKNEEKVLEEVFGEEYKIYKQRTLF